jgi:hypothetical protein
MKTNQPTNQPTVTLSPAEGQRLRGLVREHGAPEAAKLVGLADPRTIRKAATEEPISRLSAGIIRHSLDRI